MFPYFSPPYNLISRKLYQLSNQMNQIFVHFESKLPNIYEVLFHSEIINFLTVLKEYILGWNIEFYWICGGQTIFSRYIQISFYVTGIYIKLWNDFKAIYDKFSRPRKKN